MQAYRLMTLKDNSQGKLEKCTLVLKIYSLGAYTSSKIHLEFLTLNLRPHIKK